MANAGDVFARYQNDLADGAVIDARPVSPGEAVIHTIWYGGAVEIYRNDGSHVVLIDSDTSAGTKDWLAYHVTSSVYITIKNVSGGPQDFGFDGMYTRGTT